MKPTFKTLYELEQARQALMLTNLPKREKAVMAEKLGDYRSAKKLWKEVAHEADDHSHSQKYAHIRHKFCESAVEKGWKRPELVHLWEV